MCTCCANNCLSTNFIEIPPLLLRCDQSVMNMLSQRPLSALALDGDPVSASNGGDSATAAMPAPQRLASHLKWLVSAQSYSELLLVLLRRSKAHGRIDKAGTPLDSVLIFTRGTVRQLPVVVRRRRARILSATEASKSGCYCGGSQARFYSASSHAAATCDAKRRGHLRRPS